MLIFTRKPSVDWPSMVTRLFGQIDRYLEQRWHAHFLWPLVSEDRMGWVELSILAKSVELKGTSQELHNTVAILDAARLAYTDLLPFYGAKSAALVKDAFDLYCSAMRDDDEFDTGVFQIQKSFDAQEIKQNLLDNVLGKKLGTHNVLYEGTTPPKHIPGAAQDFIASHAPWLMLRYARYFDIQRLQTRHPEVLSTHEAMLSLYDREAERTLVWMAQARGTSRVSTPVELPTLDM